MDLVAEVLQGAVVRLQHHRGLVVGQLALWLGVNPAIVSRLCIWSKSQLEPGTELTWSPCEAV